MNLGTVLTNRTAVDRSKVDFYPTPAEVTHALLNELKIDWGLTIWEPACGEGHISEVLEERAYRTVSTELYVRGYGQTGVDFLATKEARGDFIITNPPFKLAEQFIRHAHHLEVGFAYLLKSQYWHAARRKPLFEEIPPTYVFPLTWRPDFLMGAKSGSPTMDVMWVVWDVDYAGETIYKPLGRPRKEMVN